MFLYFACILLSVSISNIWYLYTQLYTHIINNLLHGWFVCTIFITHSLWRIVKLTRSLRSLARLTILHNSWIKIVRTHQPWSNLYILYSKHCNEWPISDYFYIRKTAANFNPPMAKAARITIVEVLMGRNTS